VVIVGKKRYKKGHLVIDIERDCWGIQVPGVHGVREIKQTSEAYNSINFWRDIICPNCETIEYVRKNI